MSIVIENPKTARKIVANLGWRYIKTRSRHRVFTNKYGANNSGSREILQEVFANYDAFMVSRGILHKSFGKKKQRHI